MGKLVYDRRLQLWEWDDLQRLRAEGRAEQLPDLGIWIVQLPEGGKVAVRPDQILVTGDGMSMADIEAQAKAEYEAEHAWLRHAEAGDPAEIEMERDMDSKRGVVSFEDAWDAADPVHAAGRVLRHAERDAFDQATFENGKTSIGLDSPRWISRMDEIVEEILAGIGTSRELEEAKVDAVAARLADVSRETSQILSTVPDAAALLAKFIAKD